ncbi:MAG: DNA polymerase III subunit alpha, partial [Anaerovoracaceae bacterium]
GLAEEAEILPLMKKLHEETGIPFVATNDVHYVNRQDAEAHDVLLCIQTAAKVEDEQRMRFPNDQFYLKSEEEMRKLFAGFPEACDNTHKIAMACNVDFEFGKLHLPEFTAPEGKSNSEYLRELCKAGLVQRYPQGGKELEERLDYELEIIEKMGYVEYFLIVWDFIHYAKKQGIMVGPGRGSAAGSIVAYTLKITDIDPVKYNLIFERFLNPERVSMPDIDIDFCYERRGEVIDYVIDKYGEDKVSQIITFGTMKAKAAVRDVGRALDISYSETDAIAKAIPFELKMTIDKALKMNPDLNASYENDVNVRKVIDMARAIEGMPRHASTHAAGVVISKESVDEYVPLYLAEKGISTQFNMTTIEELGLLKMDFLGLRNLTVIRDALELIEKNHGTKIDFETMDYDDPLVYEMIAKGNTQGIFQLESGGMTQFMKNLKPDCFEDIVAGISLYRPGPMASIPTYIANKKNPKEIVYLHESLEPILSVTYGCMVYQEQVMQIVRDLAGYTYGRSDLLRRAMGKKKMDVMLAEKEHFIEGAYGRGVPKDVAEEIFNQMVSFAEYAFNKSHAAAYAVVGYETGYLKAHYPVEFMAALMTSVMGDAHQIAKYIRNCHEMGIEVLPPDVNFSGKKFTVDQGKIRFGLLGVKNVGENAIEAIIQTRETKGLPTDIFTFISNLPIQQVNKKAIESLIKAGALDSINPNRAQHLAIYEQLMESAQNSAKRNIEGQISLFQINTEQMSSPASAARLPNVENFQKEALSAMEKEMLGVYITDHPLNDYADQIKKLVSTTSEELNEEEPPVKDGEKVIMAGIITGKRSLITKSNKQMAFVQVEDFFGEVEVIVFHNVLQKYGQLLQEDAIILVKGTINFKEDEAPKLLADTITDIRTIQSVAVPAKFRIPQQMNEAEGLTKIKEILIRHKGETPVIIYLPGGKSLKTQGNLWINKSEALKEEMEALLGAENVKL